MMRFYYNEGMKLCAERDWVVESLFLNGLVESRKEAEDSLNTLDTYRSFFGWSECDVSNTIAENFE